MRLIARTLDQIHSPIGAAHGLLAQRSGDRELLDLSQAAPSHPPAPVVAARIAEVAHELDGARYVPQPGLPALRDAFAAELRRDYRSDHITADNVVITAGCNQAFCLVVSALAEPGDEIVLPVPYYFNHDMWLRLDGLVPRHLPPAADAVSSNATSSNAMSSNAMSSNAMFPSAAAVAGAITPRTRAVVQVTPGNPSGAILAPSDIAAHAAAARERDIALIVDETYRNYRRTEAPPHSLYDDPEWADTLVSLHSFSKDLAIPGHRVGAIVGHPDLLAEVLKLLDCVAICAPRIGQEAALTGLLEAADWRREQTARTAARQDVFESVMADRPGGFELVSAGAYFGWVRHPFAHATADVVRDLILDHDVLTIPGSAFTPTDEGFLRFSFANLDEAALADLGDRLRAYGRKNPRDLG